MSDVQSFTIAVPDAKLNTIVERVRAYRFDDDRSLDGWQYGTTASFMKRVVDYWITHYDWRTQEANLNRYPQFTADIGDQRIHFIHERGSGATPKTVLLIHGWPGSVLEFYEAIERLAHPERFAGDADDGVNVVVPSLPGYGFSGRPAHPMGNREIAGLFDSLLTDVLGYDRYITEGGDWGAFISGWLGLDHADACEGVHLTTIGLRPEGAAFFEPWWDPAEWSTEDIEFLTWERDLHAREGAYFMVHATRPQTLSYAMNDNPVGVAAWLLEKYAMWSNRPNGEDPDELFTLDELLTTVMTYLVNDAVTTSTWHYTGYYYDDPKSVPRGTKVHVPTWYAAFPDPMVPPPTRSIVERVFNVVRWNVMPRGGHFAAFEEPELFSGDVLAFARELKSGAFAPSAVANGART